VNRIARDTFVGTFFFPVVWKVKINGATQGFMSYPARLDWLWVQGVKQRERDANYLHVVARLRILGDVLPFSLLRIVQTGSGVYTASYSTGTGVLSRGEKRPGRDVDDLPPCAPQYASSSLLVAIKTQLRASRLEFVSSPPRLWFVQPSVPVATDFLNDGKAVGG
jgi:hypothetical protein